MRNVDIFTLAVGGILAFLTLIIVPYSGSWWVGMTISAVIAVLALGHFIWTSPVFWPPTGRVRGAIGILLLCAVLSAGYLTISNFSMRKVALSQVVPAHDVQEVATHEPTVTASDEPLRSIYGNVMYACNI